MENSSIVFNKTKIVATVGPSSNTKQKLEELIKAGVDVFRLNFSHGTHEQHIEVIKHVRALNEELGTPVCLLQDLQGPKIRIGEVKKGTELKPGQKFSLITGDFEGDEKKASTNYKSLATDVDIRDKILIDDGNIELLVLDIVGNEVKTQVVYGGKLKSRKGINLPMSEVSTPSLTKKDKEDLAFGLDHDFEWIALSFVRKAEDIYDLKDRIKERGKDCRIVAKIEKPQALENLDAIIEATDGVMVARGDLGVETTMEEVPMIQKMIVEKCNAANKPVIIATQMMESMILNQRPTRAETNDVANAVMDGADALMLSAETAAGEYPILTVKSMTRTIKTVEEKANVYHKEYPIDPNDKNFYSNHLVQTACRLGQDTDAKAIVGMTKSGYTGFRLSNHRPNANIFIFTNNVRLLKMINLYWGVRGFFYDKMVSTDETFRDVEDLLKEKGHLVRGDVVINTASMPIERKTRTNMLKIKVVS